MNNIVFRTFNENDYKMCCDWWEWWWRNGQGPVPRAFLPKDERCFVIEKDNIPIACYFLFIMEPRTVGWATYLVSNPEYKEKDRRDIIKLLIQNVEKEAKKYGIMQLFTVCGDVHMSNIHNSLDWIMIPVKYEGFKYLINK
tara:strand:- start:2773 stop:3195 length:423 start_codon:yes stop_codon:yes gene_type:complete